MFKLLMSLVSGPKKSTYKYIKKVDDTPAYQVSAPVHSNNVFSGSMCLTYELSREEETQLNKIKYMLIDGEVIKSVSKDVVYLLAVETLGVEELSDRIYFLNKIYDLYNPQLGSKLDYILSWISDSYIINGDLEKALEMFPAPNIKGRSGHQSDQRLSLKLALNQDINSADVLALMGPKLTKWGKENITKVKDYLDILISEKQKHEVIISKWREGCSSQKSFPVYNGSVFSNRSDKLPIYHFSNQKKILEFIKEITREAENTTREEFGIPKVGEGWVSETQLYYEIKKHFVNTEVIHHGRPKWLGRQHLDIYIPSLNVAVEYQGAQHDKPVEYFGGEEAFKKTQARDRKKMRLCKKNGLSLIYVRPGYKIEDVIGEINLSIQKIAS